MATEAVAVVVIVAAALWIWHELSGEPEDPAPAAPPEDDEIEGVPI